VLEQPVVYPDLKKLFVDTESETMFNFYLPSSLVLCKKVRDTLIIRQFITILAFNRYD
jgi:hypothetical protein